MFKRIRASIALRFWCLTVTASMLSHIIAPTAVYALTGGPSQPEVNTFTPIGTSDMVDPFSGGFNYNIPLMDVGGHPINLSYNGAPTMDQEATMVGLGWSLNAAGQINRSLRGIPDDFKSDEVIQENNMRKNWTFGVNTAFSGEAFGFDLGSLAGNSSANLGVSYNNYNGVAVSTGASVSFQLTKGALKGTSLGISGTNSSANGLTIEPSLSFSKKFDREKKKDFPFSANLGIGAPFNSRQGLTAVTVEASAAGTTKGMTLKAKKEGQEDGSLYMNTSSNGSSISLMNNTYVPNLDLPRTTNSVSGSFKPGTGFFGADVDGVISAYYTEQKLAEEDKVRSFPSFGTAYQEEGTGNPNAMLDFNREKQRSFSRSIPSLHTTNHTYDLFSISGQGVGGMFRTFRSEVGYVHDNLVSDKSNGGKASLEVAGGNLADIGASGGVTFTRGASGNWEEDNQARNNFNYRRKTENDDYEPFYLKHTGEITVDPEMQESATSLFGKSGGYEPVHVGVYAKGFEQRTRPFYVRNGYDPENSATNDKLIPLSNNGNQRNTRAKRNQIITTLTKEETSFGVDKYQSSAGKDHHFSEMTVLQNNGSRYVYGIPAYNKTKKDVSFNATGRSVNANKGMVTYVAGEDNSRGNERGRDYFYNSTTLPGYAHSYLLTSILSHDYVDRTNDGVTADDYGNFTKFNYGTTPDIPNYKWRIPYNKDEANYSEGLKTDPGDDRGNYVYGEKELWYLDNIETKTHVAVFHMSNRRDGYGVADENGGMGGSPMKKLDKISLYARPDYEANVNNLSQATPIMEVHFKYDYSLCPNIDNNKPGTSAAENNPVNQGGKLTLKRLYFTYAKSYKGELTDYQFVYADPDHDGVMEANFPYDLKSVNAWGCYQAQESNAGYNVDNGLLNAEFPYVRQDDNYTTLKNNVNAWALTSIKLPSGGRMEVDLEPHEYAHVQNQEVLRMYKVLGFSNTSGRSAPVNNELYGGLTNTQPNLFLHFEVPSGTTREQLFKSLINNKPLYYRFLVDLTNSFDKDDGSYEYVEGYLSKEVIESYDVSGNRAWVELKGISTNGDGGNGDANPISKSAWQFARLHVPRKAFNQPDPQEGEPLKDIAKVLISQVTNMTQLYAGANGFLRSKGFGKHFKPEKSWIRLNTSNGKKYGASCRVAEIRMYDNWESMTEKSTAGGVGSDGFNHDFDYGQTYEYVLEDGISTSGVATYEPMGAKDNPLVQPVYFSEEHLLAPDGEHYMEKPYGESFYPGPSIGYSRIEVANLQRFDDQNNNGVRDRDAQGEYTEPLLVSKHATGKMVHEYYTCRDYPVITRNTELFSREKRTNILGRILKINSKNFAVASQGFVIETNDMHGKQKGQKVYAEGQTTPISGVEYVYNQENVKPSGNLGGLFPSLNEMSLKRLNNNLTVITPEGKIETRQIGVDFDMINDFGENKTWMADINVDGNLASFLAAIIPVAVPTVFPRAAVERTRYRYASTTKVINRFGILSEVIAYDLGARVSTKNRAWDSETGEVLLTETTNEYGDQVFNFNYPAHWYYSGMGQAYQNIGMDLTLNTNQDGVVTNSAAIRAYLEPGDEIATSTGKLWVDDVLGGLRLIDINGEAVAAQTVNGKIVRSGHRNMQAMAIGSVTMLEDPLADGNGAQYANGTTLPFLTQTSSFNTNKVTNTMVNEFSDDWKQDYCNCDLEIQDTYNPYVHNNKGTWRLKREHLYLVDRNQTAAKTTREEGTYQNYRPFWRTTGSTWLKNNQNYTWSSQVTRFSPYGFELENQDRLGRYSAAQFDYNNTLPTAVANNARYSDIGFDGFEDYDFDECSDDHFSFESELNHAPQKGATTQGEVTIDENTSHTGRKSIKLAPGASVKLKKDLQNCPTQTPGNEGANN